MATKSKPAAKPKGRKAASGTTKKPARPASRNSAAGKSLVIVESPAKARTVGQILGNKYVVAASQGMFATCRRAKSAWTWSTTLSRPTS